MNDAIAAGLAIVFDQNVKPDYQVGISQMIANGQTQSKGRGRGDSNVVLQRNVDLATVEHVIGQINAAAVGLRTKFEPQRESNLGLGYIVEVDGRTHAAANRLVVSGPV